LSFSTLLLLFSLAYTIVVDSLLTMTTVIVPAGAIPSPKVLGDAVADAENDPDGMQVYVWESEDGVTPIVTQAQLYLTERILSSVNDHRFAQDLGCDEKGSVYDQALTYGAPVAMVAKETGVSDEAWAKVMGNHPVEGWLPKPLLTLAEDESKALGFDDLNNPNATIWWLLRDVSEHNCTLRAEAVNEVWKRSAEYIDPDNAYFSTAAKRAAQNQLQYELERQEQTFLETTLFIMLIFPLAGNVPMQSPIISLIGLAITPYSWFLVVNAVHLWASITAGDFSGVSFAVLFWIVFAEQVRVFLGLLYRYRLQSFSLWLDMSDEFLRDERAFADEYHVRRLFRHNEPAPWWIRVRELVTRTPVRVLAGMAGIVYVSTNVALTVSEYALYAQSSQEIYDAITSLFHHWAADAILFVVIPIVRPILIFVLGVFFPAALVGFHLRTFLHRTRLLRQGKIASSFQAPFYLAMFYLGYTWVQALGSMALLFATCIVLTIGITAIILSPSLASHVITFLMTTVLSSVLLHTMTTAMSRMLYWSPSYPRKVLRNPRLFTLQDACTSAIASPIMGPTVLMLRLAAHCVYFVIDFGRVDVSTTRGVLRSFDLPYASFNAVVGIHRIFGNPTANHFLRITMTAAAERTLTKDDVRRRRTINRFWLCLLLHRTPFLIPMRAAAIAEARQPTLARRIMDTVKGAAIAGASATAHALHVPMPTHARSHQSDRYDVPMVHRHRRSRSRRRSARKGSMRVPR
jgi:hypothetical protein